MPRSSSCCQQRRSHISVSLARNKDPERVRACHRSQVSSCTGSLFLKVPLVPSIIRRRLRRWVRVRGAFKSLLCAEELLCSSPETSRTDAGLRRRRHDGNDVEDRRGAATDGGKPKQGEQAGARIHYPSIDVRREACIIKLRILLGFCQNRPCRPVCQELM